MLIIRDSHFLWCKKCDFAALCPCKKTAYLIAVFAVALVGICEVFGSYLAGSYTLWADGFHMLKDMLGYLAAFIGAGIMLKKHSAEESQKVNRFFGILSAVILIVIALLILTEAVFQVLTEHGSFTVRGSLVSEIAALAFLANLGIFLMFRAFDMDPHPHMHVHDHSGHHHEDHIHKNAVLHVFGDMLISLCAVVTGLLVFFLGPGYGIIDRYASMIVSLILLLFSIRIIRGVQREKASDS